MAVVNDAQRRGILDIKQENKAVVFQLGTRLFTQLDGAVNPARNDEIPLYLARETGLLRETYLTENKLESIVSPIDYLNKRKAKIGGILIDSQSIFQNTLDSLYQSGFPEETVKASAKKVAKAYIDARMELVDQELPLDSFDRGLKVAASQLISQKLE